MGWLNWVKAWFSGEPRSPAWAKLSKKLISAQPYCSACGTKTNLEVHHLKPFHLFPELELVEENCIVLCRDHHFFLGHACNWDNYVINCKDISSVWLNTVKLAKGDLPVSGPNRVYL